MYYTAETELMRGYSREEFGPYADWSDEDLLLEYRLTGKRELFEQLVKRYERSLYNYLARYIGNAEDAEEVFQSTFMQVHLKCELFEEGRRFRPWLYRIATNLAIDGRRRDQKHDVLKCDTDFDGNEDGDLCGLTQIIADDQPGPVENSIENERIQQVHDAIASLPEHYRHVLNLVYFQGFSYREAAETLGIPFGTIKSRLNKVFRKLTHLLREL